LKFHEDAEFWKPKAYRLWSLGCSSEKNLLLQVYAIFLGH
jgi:hypothetical protein